MRIGIYFSAFNFGGHEEIACRVIELLSSVCVIEIYCPIKNSRLLERIENFKNQKNICVHIFKCKNSNGFSKWGIIKSTQDFIYLFRKISSAKKIENFIFIDGGFGASLFVPLAPKLWGIKVISYLPLIQKNLENSFIAKIYANILIDKFITINDRIKNTIENYISYKVSVINNPISIVYNDIFLRTSNCRKKILFLGRIDFNHKQQDKFLKFIEKNSIKFEGISIDFFGDGEDFLTLEGLIKNSFNKNIRLFKWKDWSRDFSSYNVVVLYSSYEGEPVVCIDSILNNTPIICLEGLVDINLVPEKFLFKYNDIDSFLMALDNAINNGYLFFEEIKNKLLENRSDESIRNKWIECLIH
jgi:hypothetical protein